MLNKEQAIQSLNIIIEQKCCKGFSCSRNCPLGNFNGQRDNICDDLNIKNDCDTDLALTKIAQDHLWNLLLEKKLSE